MKIRKAIKADIEEIKDLCIQTILTVNRKDYSKEETEDWAFCGESLEKWKQRLEEQTYWVAVKSKQIVGLGSLKGGKQIGSFFVHKDYQRKGVGNVIMKQILLQAKELKTEKLDSEVSLTAKAFFLAHGFSVVKEQQAKANKLHLTNFVMEKVL